MDNLELIKLINNVLVRNNRKEKKNVHWNLSCDPNLQKLCGVVSASKQATRKKLGVDGLKRNFESI